jgi:hypothetical protein
MTEATSKRIPPYLAFKTFLNSLDTLSQGIPTKLDRSFWKNQSGINQGLLMGAYRFFWLVNERDESTEYLITLAQHPDKRAATLKKLITDQYLVVLEKGDITKSTMKMLEDAFGEVYPVTGETKQKAITFFLKAAKFADMSLSPYLLTQLRNEAKKPRKTRQRAGRQELGNDPPSNQNGSTGSSHTAGLIGGGHVTLTISANPFTMPEEDRRFFFSLVDLVQKYAAEHPETQKEESETDDE